MHWQGGEVWSWSSRQGPTESVSGTEQPRSCCLCEQWSRGTQAGVGPLCLRHVCIPAFVVCTSTAALPHLADIWVPPLALMSVHPRVGPGRRMRLILPQVSASLALIVPPGSAAPCTCTGALHSDQCWCRPHRLNHSERMGMTRLMPGTTSVTNMPIAGTWCLAPAPRLRRYAPRHYHYRNARTRQCELMHATVSEIQLWKQLGPVV